MSAAWLEGLSEEWKEPSTEAENLTSSSDGGGAASARTAAQPSTMDFGSIVVKDPMPYRGGAAAAAGDATGLMGTTILHGIQAGDAAAAAAGEGSIVEQQQQGDGSIIQHSAPGSFIQRSSPKKSVAALFSRTPSGSLSNNNNQLAWAISAFTKGNGNLLAEQTPKTPNRLQMLFIDAASPTPLGGQTANSAAAPASMPDALLDGGQEAREQQDVQKREHAERHEGNTAAPEEQQPAEQTEEYIAHDQDQLEESEEQQGGRARPHHAYCF